MQRASFGPPSAVTVIAAALVALAVAFVRCQPKAPAAAPVASSAGAKNATPASVVPPEAADAAAELADAAPPEAGSGARRAYTVAVIGDSLTDAKSAGGGYVRYVAERCPESRFDNYGKGGDMLTHMRMRYRADLFGAGVVKPRYTHLVLFGGVNDLYSPGRNPKNISADLLRIYDAARERGMRVVAVTVAPWGGFTKYYNPTRAAATRELNDWIHAQLEAKTVDHVIDAYALLSCGDPEKLCPEVSGRFKDGLHFGPVGHEKIGAALYEKVFADCR